MLIDSHAHLNFSDYGNETSDVIERARAAGLINIINIGSGDGIKGNFEAFELTKKYSEIYSTIGFHPHDATNIKAVAAERAKPKLDEAWQSKLCNYSSTDPYETIKKLADDPKVVAVGEIGLDYHFIAKDPNFEHLKTDQIECFKKLLAMAGELKLPVVIHDREAHDDTLFTLRHHSKTENGGVMHCFSGSTVLARHVLDLGYYISITGAVTFSKKAEVLQEVVRFVPIEHLLIETDCPFIAPEPFRGKRNEPAYVKLVAEKIAELKGLSVEDVGRITTQNAQRLFHLPGEIPTAKIAYPIRQSLYLNITNRCSLACTFCPKRSGTFEVKGHNLKLSHEPDIEDVFRAIGDLSGFKEVVFCGFGEPTMRIELIKTIARRLKDSGVKMVRLDTDGLANLVHGRNVLPELHGLIDAVSVSLNAHNAEVYKKLCPSKYGQSAFLAVCDFIREAKKYIPDVTASVVSCPEVDIKAAKKLAEQDLGVSFKARIYQEVG